MSSFYVFGRYGDRYLYPGFRHHVCGEPAVDPESGQELPLLLLRINGHVRFPGSVRRFLRHFLCYTVQIWSKEKPGEAAIRRSHDQNGHAQLLMKLPCAINRHYTNIVDGRFCYLTIIQFIPYLERKILMYYVFSWGHSATYQTSIICFIINKSFLFSFIKISFVNIVSFCLSIIRVDVNVINFYVISSCMQRWIHLI